MDFLKPTTENFSIQGKLIDNFNKKRNLDNMQKIKQLYQDAQHSSEKSKHQQLLETLKSKKISDIFHIRTDSDKEAVQETQRHFKIMQEILPSLKNKDRISSTDKYKDPLKLPDYRLEKTIESPQKFNNSSLFQKHTINLRYQRQSLEDTMSFTPNKPQSHLHTQQSQTKSHSEQKNSVFSIREQYDDLGEEGEEDGYYAVGNSFKGNFIYEEYQASKKAFSVKSNGRRFSVENSNPSNKAPARRASNANGQLKQVNSQSLMIQSLFQHGNKKETSHQKTVKSRGSTSEEEGEELVVMSDTYNRIFEKSGQKKQYSLQEMQMLNKQGYLDKNDEEGRGENQIQQSYSWKGNAFNKQELGVQGNTFPKNELFTNRLSQHLQQSTGSKLPKNSMSLDFDQILKPIPKETISSDYSYLQTKTESSQEARVQLLNQISGMKKEHLLSITSPRKRIQSEHQQSTQDISQKISKIIGNSRNLYATIFQD